MKRLLLNALAGVLLILAMIGFALWVWAFFAFGNEINWQLAKVHEAEIRLCGDRVSLGVVAFVHDGPTHEERDRFIQESTEARRQGTHLLHIHHHLGFWFVHGDAGFWGANGLKWIARHVVEVRVPAPVLIALLLIYPVIRLIRWRQAFTVRLRIRQGLCLTCGYDLRATPLRCPECGTIAPAKQ